MNTIRRMSIWQRVWLVVAICGLIYALGPLFHNCIGSPRECALLEDIGVPFLSWLLYVVLLYAIGAAGAWFARGRATLLYGVGAVAAVWFAAFAIESATRLMGSLFAEFGAELPYVSLLTIDAVQSYVPWILAVTSTLIIVYLAMRTSDYFVHACAVVAGVAAVLASFVVLSLVLPISKCGVIWPEWPGSSVQLPERSQRVPDLARNSDAPRRAPAGECR